MAAILKRQVLLSTAAARKVPKAWLYVCRNCLASNSSIEHEAEEIVYPPIKPKYPPGDWQTMSPKEAWQWYEDKEKIDSLPTVSQRLYENIELGNQLYYFNTRLITGTPDLLDYQKEITKTEEKEIVASSYDISDERWKCIHSDIQDLILDEHTKIRRSTDHRLTSKEAEIQKQTSLLSALLSRMVVLLTHDKPALLSSELASDVLVQTHWLRGGEMMDLHGRCTVRNSAYRFGYKNNAIVQLRQNMPISNAIDRDLCQTVIIEDDGVEVTKQKTGLSDNTLENKEEENLEDTANKKIQFNPHRLGQISKKGALPRIPGFLYGSPCEYVTLSVVGPDEQTNTYRERLGEKLFTKAVHGAGVVHSFATCHAMAHYQGYDLHHDLIHPLSTQTIFTDGKEFTFFYYQLNTMRLIVGDKDNRSYNAVTFSETNKLYEHIEEGKIIGFNPDVVTQLGQCVLRSLVDSVAENPYLTISKTPLEGDLLPYLPTYDRRQDIPVLDSGSVQIPTFIRYTNASIHEDEWDLSYQQRKTRKEEKNYTEFITRGPLYDSYNPPARGETILDQHFTKVRLAEEQKRLEWRSAIEKQKRLQSKMIRKQMENIKEKKKQKKQRKQERLSSRRESIIKANDDEKHTD